MLRALTPSGLTTRFVVAVAFAGALSAACDVHSPTGPGTLASITVTPNVTLAINATQQFIAVGKDADGNVIALTPTWSVVAGGGAIDNAGLFTAGTVLGTFTNTVQASSGSISGTATVTVIAGALATITVTPNPDTLPITGTQQYTAVGKDAGGNVVSISPSPTWSIVANGGTINSGTGLFNAGLAPGTFTNTVQATSGSVSGHATVVVIAGPVATITVTPNPDTLPITGTQQYTAVGKDAGGNVVTITPTWSVVAGGGAITSSGLFTAGTVLGTFASTVQATSGSISGRATVVVTTGALATITVSPTPVTLPITGTQQYAAVGKDAGGNVVAITPTWSVAASGGTITSSGLFTAGAALGTFASTVTATVGAVAGTASVTVIAGPLASITVTPNPVTLPINGTQQYTAVGKDAGGNVVAIAPTWSVVASMAAAGTINSSSGQFTAGTTPATYTGAVQATSGSITGFATVTVIAGPLASITVTPNPVTLAITGTQTFTAVGKDASGNVVTITPTWSVVAGGGAITSAGLFTAGTVPGTFTNTVEAASGSVSATATVTVTSGALATIVVAPNPVTLPITGTQQYTAVGKDAGGNVVAIAPTWSVVAGGGTITTGGLFTAGTVPGTFTNTVEATSGSVSGTATVTVTSGALATIVVTPNPVTLPINGTQQYTAVGKDAGGNVVAIAPTWSVVAGGGAITTGGLFTAGTVPGTFANTVEAASGSVSGTATVTVTSGVLATILVTPNPVTLPINGTQQYTAVGKDAGGNVVTIAPTWSVVAGGGTITGSGLFTAGTALGTFISTVTATVGAVAGTASVTVIAGPVATITVTPNPVTLPINGTQQYTAVGKDAGGNVVTIAPTWSVVAGGGAISSTGLFSAGTVLGTFANTVEATSGSISGTGTVTVIAGPLASITVTPNPVTLPINGTQQYTAVGTDAGGNVVAIAPTWSVVAGGGAITSAGLFTAGTVPGTFANTVEATSGSVSGTATVVVTTGALATIVVTPNPITLPISGTQQYTAVGKDAGGNVVAIAPTWSVVAGGGAISSAGLFTAGTVPGTFASTVQATSGSISGTGTVVVTTGALATIVVTPNPVTLPISGTQQYTAVGKDAGGNVVAIAPTWSVVAGGGAITGAGFFTAGTLPGTFTNTVQATSGSVSGTATVTVTTGALATIVVTPNPVTLPITGTQQYTAVGKDAGGNVVAIAPTWSVVAGGGAITSSGLFTAGTALGTFANTVEATSGSISGTATVTVIAGPLATITVTPTPVTLPITGTQQYTAVGTDAGGNVVTIAPTWSVVAGGGAISSTGLFTAGTVLGTFANTVEATSGSISGTATVTVIAGPLATITVTPNPVTLPTTGTQQFTAVGTDAGGNVVAIAPTWSVVAGGGAITSTGLFTAGTVPGTYTNTVEATSGSISGFATVTVTVNLGTAATFAVLGNTAVTCSAVSTVYGNVGVDPSGAISGFPSPCVISAPGDGILHLNDAAAAAAQADVATANSTLAGMAYTTDLTGQDLGGMTLTPGVYRFTSSAQLTGELKLGGPATGIWVFQIGSTLTTAASSKVTLIGGANAGNVYWQIGTSATLGASNAPFLGTIIANASIGLGAGTSLTGRALAQTGAVTLNTNIITLPSP